MENIATVFTNESVREWKFCHRKEGYDS